MHNQDGDLSHGIYCSAVHCKFNRDGKKCSASSIDVGNPSAKNSRDTMCETYSDK
ncbi:MAG: DUF1540 domain-containing protein [Bacillota bacterium]|nr:DUF1540 domain-containing protein [Bacillota bacterium]